MDYEDQINRKEAKIGINRLIKTEGIFSRDTIIQSQESLMEKEKQRAKQKEGVWCKEVNGRELYVITKVLAEEVVKQIHQLYGHPGIRKTWLIFRKNYIATNDGIITKKIINRCEVCQRAKEKNYHNGVDPKSIVTQKPLQTIAIDFLSNLIRTEAENKHILVIVDVFSKYITMYACRKTNTKTTIILLIRYFEEVGKPEKCVMDNATYLPNRRLTTFLHKNQVHEQFTSMRNPSANPAERYIKEVVKYLRIMTQGEHTAWDKKLHQIEEFINHIPSSVTEEPPVYLMHGLRPIRSWIIEEKRNNQEIVQEVNEKFEKRAEKFIKRQKKKIKQPVYFQKDDLVW